ncbi:ATP-binding protein [Aliarcobacter butzleri]|uniref:ATP-binding protein n=1 Tax=Aliarcobacter butzleri TaxID=28197 RepID=UPI0021B402A5|nr:ATP-binding protein [Aliarcobacter butzleri]MCT7547977.1 ATP-binding protein [Aliarcobacter butzleri]
MELVYLWVEEYKNIEKQGFNFSPRFRCEYDEEKNELTINENKDYVNIFPDNINITAIVGENGSGKTTLIRCLVNNFMINKKIVCFSNNSILINSSLDLINNKTHYKIEKLDDELYNLIFFNKNFVMDIPNNSIFSSLYLENNNLYLKYFDYNKDKFILNIHHFYKKVLENIFLNKHKTVFFNPTKISIHFNYLCKEYMGSKEIKNNNNLEDIKYRYKVYLKSFEISETINNDKEIIKILHTKEMQKFLNNSKEKILNYDYDKYIDTNISLLIEKDENIYNFLNKYFVYKESQLLRDKEFLFEEARKLKFLILEKDIEIFFYLNRIGFLEYDFFDDKKSFLSLSSGEKSFFSDMIILSNGIKDFLNLKKDRKFLTLILDEPETTLHPQWQKLYISYLIQFFSKNFTQNIHIILTSHSPFIISDLPKENVIFLEKGKQVYPFEDGKQTFGANIHTLLSHGFFMKNGLMGEFAKDKIQSIIKYHEDIEKKEILEADKVEYKTKKQKEFWQIQSIIGDDYLKQVIKNHLVEIEKIVLGNDEAKKEEIKRLKAQIELLEK